MSMMVTIGNIASLEEFQNLVLPIAQSACDRTASLPTEPNTYYINIDPELMVSVASFEFVKRLPKEYWKLTDKPNEQLYPSKPVTIAKAIPHDVVVDIMRKMKVLTFGD